MAKTLLSTTLFAAFAVAFLAAQTTAEDVFVVGGPMGWLVPPGGPIAYATWAALQSFEDGDILVFNFTTGEQDVARVTKEAFESCDTKNPIWIEKNGPARFTLAYGGDYYFISTLDRHCQLGQKLSVNVTGPPGPTTSPALVPSRPRAPMNYTVGDVLGWFVPPGGSIFYSAWAKNKAFVVGDTLVFNFINRTQDVAVVTKADYETCETDRPITTYTTSPARYTLTSPGMTYFTSTYDDHCELGQRLAINVVAATARPPSGSTMPPSGSAMPPSGSAMSPSGSPAPTSGLPQSSAPSLAVMSFFYLTILSIATSFVL